MVLSAELAWGQRGPWSLPQEGGNEAGAGQVKGPSGSDRCLEERGGLWCHLAW